MTPDVRKFALTVHLACSVGWIVLAVGRESRGYPAYEVNVELAKELGKHVIELPGGHLGFVSQPAEFAHELVQALARQG